VKIRCSFQTTVPEIFRGKRQAGTLRNVGLILRVKWRLVARLLRDNLFDVFVLAPIILYGAFLQWVLKCSASWLGWAAIRCGILGPETSCPVASSGETASSWRRLVEALELPNLAGRLSAVSTHPADRALRRCFLSRYLNNSVFLTGLSMFLNLSEGDGFGFLAVAGGTAGDQS
jgi:hypothetical protein